MLHPRIARGVRVDTCAGCQGVWFDEGELTALARAEGYDALREGSLRHWFAAFPAPGAPCPGCGGPGLHQGSVHQLSLSLCDACGGFFLPKASVDELASLAQKRPREGWFSNTDGLDPSFVGETLLEILAGLLR